MSSPARTGIGLRTLLLGSALAFVLPSSTSAQASVTRAPHPTVAALQKRHNRALYAGVQSFRSREAPTGEAIVGDNTDPWGMAWTKCTNLGIHLLSTLVAERRGLVDHASAKRQIRGTVEILAKLKGYRGIFPENIQIRDGVAAEVIDGRMRFSSIDSAWVTVALSLVEVRYRGLDRDLAQAAGELVKRQDYGVFVGSDGLLGAGFYVDVATQQKLEPIAFSYNDRNSEARPLVLALVGMGLLPASAWDNTVYEWGAREGLPLAKGWHYSAFVEMTGALFFDENKLAPLSLGKSHQNYVEANVRVAQRLGQRWFGYAPACDAQNPYAEFGLDRPNTVSPYAAALLTMAGDPRASSNLSAMLELLPRDGSPLPDGLDPISGAVSCRVARVLDQGLTFLALNADVIRNLVRKTSWYPSAERRLQAMDQSFQAPQPAEPELKANAADPNRASSVALAPPADAAVPTSTLE